MSKPSKKSSAPKIKLDFSKKNIEILKKKYLTTLNKAIGGAILGVSLITMMSLKACEPRKGSILYGICDAFLQQQVSFPETIKYQTIEQYQRATRLYYSTMGTFGEQRLDMIECTFVLDEANNLSMDGIIFNHVRPITKEKPISGKGRLFQVRKEVIDHFNMSGSIPAIIAGEPDLTLPDTGEDLLKNIYAED